MTDFAAGSLAMSEAVCVAAHLEFCGKCRAHVQQLSDVAAQMMARLEPIADEHDGFESLMQRIDSAEPAAPQESAVRAGRPALAASGIPRVVEKLAGGNLQDLNWVKLGGSL
ncbi:MAG: hypothetical protein Q8L38_03825, partial [Pseudohongiella sp.]|nr:hypothetical protein [Pseudohongiella sp.]